MYELPYTETVKSATIRLASYAYTITKLHKFNKFVNEKYHQERDELQYTIELLFFKVKLITERSTG